MKLTQEKLEELKAMAERAKSHFSIELAEAFANSVPDLIADLENERARGIHSCNDNCTRNGCVNVRIRKELAEAVTLYNDTLRKLSAEYAEAKRQWKLGYAEGNREVQHWRANHESVVKKLRLFTQRDDLPVDRLPAYEYVLELEKKLAEAQAREREALDMLGLMFGKYEHGSACFESPEDETVFLGNAIHLTEDQFKRITTILDDREETKRSALDTAIAEAIEQYRRDAERYRWLTNDHDSPDTRKACHDISARIPVMSYSAASQSIDAAIAAKGESA